MAVEDIMDITEDTMAIIGVTDIITGGITAVSGIRGSSVLVGPIRGTHIPTMVPTIIPTMAIHMAVTTAGITATSAMDMAMIAAREWPSSNADLRGTAITLEPSMDSWGRRHGEHCVIPNGATGTTITGIATAGIEIADI